MTEIKNNTLTVYGCEFFLGKSERCMTERAAISVLLLNYMYLPYVADASPAPREAPPTGPPLIIPPPNKTEINQMNPENSGNRAY